MSQIENLIGKPSKKRIRAILAFGRKHEKAEIDELATALAQMYGADAADLKAAIDRVEAFTMLLRTAIESPVVLNKNCMSAGWITKMLTPEEY